MNPGNPDVVEADYLIPQHLGGDSCFFGHRNVACSARSDDHFADSGGSGHYTDDTGARQLVIIQRSDPTQTLPDEVRDLLRDPGDQNGLLTVLEHGLRDPEDVFLRFPRTVDDLGNTLSDAAMHVHLGIFSDFLDRFHLQLQRGVVGRDFTFGYLLKQLVQFRFIHDDTPVNPVGMLLGRV